MKNSGVYFSALVTALLGVLFLLLVFETWALLFGQTPITGYVRSTVHAFPGWSFVAAVVIGMLIGHVLWGGPAAIARLRQSQ
jgi:hypothetical protein